MGGPLKPGFGLSGDGSPEWESLSDAFSFLA